MMSFLAHLSPGSVVRLSVGGALIVLLFWYASFQGRLLIAGPSVTLDNMDTVVTTRTVSLSGTVQNVTDITLNGRQIFVNDSGRFSERITLPRGYTIMTIEAHDRYGRTVLVEQPLVYAPAYDGA